jgi:hypothetical protein
MSMLFWTTIGCAADEPTPEALLRELARVHADELFTGVQSAVEVQVGSLWDLDDESSERGTVHLPEDAGPVWDADAVVAVAWDVTFDLDEGVRTWAWAMTLSIESLSLHDAEVSGNASWAVEDVVWDLRYANHEWNGEVSVDGAAPVPAAWTAYYSGNLHRVDGTLDGVEVTWINEHPDLP